MRSPKPESLNLDELSRLYEAGSKFRLSAFISRLSSALIFEPVSVVSWFEAMFIFLAFKFELITS